jgi:hypothetical protein
MPETTVDIATLGTVLPDEGLIAAELGRSRGELEERRTDRRKTDRLSGE